jgi:anaerobic selenocysteine-containing dehydrogenase
MDVKTYCRLCHGLCGLVATIEDGKVTAVRGDHDHALTRGYACIKGLQYPELHHGPGRLRESLKRKADSGGHAPIASEAAFGEIAARLGAIVDAHGPHAVAVFSGTQSAYNILHGQFARSFMQSLGSRSHFSTMSIDQSAKWVAAERLGAFASGRQNFFDSEVWLFAGTNPLVSLQGGTLSGAPIYNPMKSLREAKARGLKLIVVDPRRSETARHADLHLQALPGEDAVIFAALINIILSEGWQDAEFCARFVNGLAGLAAAVKPFTPALAARRADVPEAQLRQAARMFAREARTGMASSGTGPDMGPYSNLSEHLIECLNVICGRYAREGTKIRHPGVLASHKPAYAEVIGPNRGWEKGPQSRVADAGMLMGQMMSGVLADEILTEGEGQIRALICAGGNPAAALPDQEKAVRALQSLDLLVTIDPRYSETARLADYVIAPTLALERPDHTRGHEPQMPIAFAQYTPKLVDPPAGSDVVDDWYVYWSLARRLGLPLSVSGRGLDMDHAPSADELLAMMTGRSPISLDEVKRYPGGKVFETQDRFVQPARPEASDRFEVAPQDVVEELAEVLQASSSPALTGGHTHRLVVRRTRELMNTLGKDVAGIRKRVRFNPAWMNPADMAALGLAEGDPVTVRSSDGAIAAIVQGDEAVRAGVVSMSHGWGVLPGEAGRYETDGSATTRLIGRHHRVERINAMPQMTAIPIAIEKRDAAGSA